ncbi:hypothetical protein O3P69_018906 [Scylla paramamosain]|uniref:Uncharacterized protein n=1 Tax=Scylla paramamosain TaxID=85552 RepID=A0AAW0SED3_SCYPA
MYRFKKCDDATQTDRQTDRCGMSAGILKVKRSRGQESRVESYGSPDSCWWEKPQDSQAWVESQLRVC